MKLYRNKNYVTRVTDSLLIRIKIISNSVSLFKPQFSIKKSLDLIIATTYYDKDA